MAQYGLKTLTTEHLPDLKIGGGESGLKLPENLHIYTKEDMVVVNKIVNSSTGEKAYEIYIADYNVGGGSTLFEFNEYSVNTSILGVGALVDENDAFRMEIILSPPHNIPTPGENNEENKADLPTNFFIVFGDYENLIPK